MLARRKKTSISIDEELWKQFIMYVIQKTGSAHAISRELERILKEYLIREGVLSEN